MRGRLFTSTVVCVAAWLTGARQVEASGALLSPQPVGEEDYAVNAQGEQVIFELEPGFVTAHVLIQYSGAPERFAWIVPVPSAPEVSLSDERAFALLDDRTRPLMHVEARDICPKSQWQCHYAWECGASIDDTDDVVPSTIQLVDRAVVGGYETIVFQASEGDAAVQWLRDEGFLVNDTITPYIQRYVDRGMLFVAAKLVPGADATAIAPLKLRYAADYPELPLELTAVAADPHMTVTAFVYGEDYVRPAVQPIVELDDDRFARDSRGRVNYPMVLARTIDEHGGGAFVVEYRGAPPLAYTKAHSGCCEQPGDYCVLEDNGTCDCLRDDWDQDDCTGFLELIPAMEMLDELAARHGAFTRLTTRLSPEEMTADPFFVPDFVSGTGQAVALGFHYTLDACEPAILDEDEYRAALARLDCAAVYCGHGTCATTESGAACACDAGYVARVFTDLDRLPSVTCVPEVPVVDLEAGGIDLPDPCTTTSCGAGACVDQNGVATCACESGAAAVVGEQPHCVPIVELTGSPGGEDFSDSFTDVRVCAPPPPTCGADGLLVFHEEIAAGVSCGGEVPDPSRVGDPCDDGFFEGCGCRTSEGGAGGAFLGIIVVLLSWRRKEAV
jgi:MYXO-CTERM domain-containing protein